MAVGSFQNTLPLVLREHRDRIRALEALSPSNGGFVCPVWDEVTPSLILAGAGVLTQPGTPSTSQFDLTCTTGEGDPGQFWTTGEIFVGITTPGTGTANTHYVIGWNAAIGVGAATGIVGYGRCRQNGGTISYPALLTAGGQVQIQGVDDTGGGGTPTFARPDFPFMFGANDVLFEGHYQCWGGPSL